MKITITYFSGTNTTKKITTEIANAMTKDIQHYNITSKKLTHDNVIPKDELLIVGMPVYGGRIPKVAVDSLMHFKGEHTPVVLLAVYGNREYEDALVEMQDIVESNGFFVMAAATFIAQHSIFPQTATGRPDASDFVNIRAFAKRCKEIAEHGFDKETQSVVLPGNRPYKTPKDIPLKVVTNDACTACGACVQVCPVDAIQPENPRLTDYSKCIHCGRCIFVCSSHARFYDGLLYKVAGALFSWKNRKRKEPQFFF